MNKTVFAAILLALAGGTLASRAQQSAAGGQVDPAFLQKAIQSLQQARNNAQDQLAAEQARRMMLEEEVAKLQKDLAEVKKPESK